LPGGDYQKRNPARHPALRSGIQEAMDRIPRPEPDRAEKRCLKAFGERIVARHSDSQTTEPQTRVALINRFNALGTAEIVRMACQQCAKQRSRFKRELRNNAMLKGKVGR